MKSLMPLTVINTENIFDENGLPTSVKYLQGSPRQYRFNASQGVLNLNGQQVLTQPKQAFSFTPIAYRYFEDNLFGKDEKAWVEFFFLNESLHVCSVMFHGFSAQEFKKHYSDYLFYDDLTPCECVFTVTPTQHKNEKANSTYFICEFSSVKATPETIEAVRVLVETLQPIYRDETLKSSEKHLSSMNFRLAESESAKAMRLINEAEEQAKNIAYFDAIGASVPASRVKKAA